MGASYPDLFCTLLYFCTLKSTKPGKSTRKQCTCCTFKSTKDNNIFDVRRTFALFGVCRRRLYLRQLSFCFRRGVVVAIVAVRSIVVFVLVIKLYSSPATRLHHVRSIIRSLCLHLRACVFVVVIVDNTSSWFLFTFVRVSKYVVTLCSWNDVDITSSSGFLCTFVSVSRYVSKIILVYCCH